MLESIEDRQEANALETIKILTTEIEQYRKRMNASTVSYLTLAFVTTGLALRFRAEIDLLAATAIAVYMLLLGLLTASVVRISRTRANYAKYLRQDLVSRLRLPEGLRCTDGAPLALTLDVDLDSLPQKLAQYRSKKPGLTRSYLLAILGVAAVTIASAFYLALR